MIERLHVISPKPHEAILAEVKKRSIPLDEIALVGRTALSFYGVGRPGTIETVVSEAAYRALRQQDGWHEAEQTDDAAPSLHNGPVEARLEWHNQTLPEIAQQTPIIDGMQIVPLEQIVQWKNQRDLPQDRHDLRAISGLLSNTTVDPRLMAHELDLVRRHLPEHLHDNPALLVAAHGLYAVRAKFGSGHQSLNYYMGAVETEPTPAAWRSGLHTETVMIDGQRYATKKRLDDKKRLTLVAAASLHDIEQGCGRGDDHGHDEGESAETFARLSTLYGIDDEAFIEGGQAGIRATFFSEATKGQNIDPARGHMDIQLGVAGPDLATVDRAMGPAQAFGVMIENGCRKELAHQHGQVLARELADYNRQRPPEERIFPRTVREFLRFIDKHGRDSKEYAVKFMAVNGAFFRSHNYPDSYDPGYGFRTNNADFMDQGAIKLREGLSLEAYYDDALAYAEEGGDLVH